RGDVRRWRKNVARGIRRERVVDAREVDVRIFLCELRDVVREDEPYPDDEVHVFRREQTQTCFAIGAFAGFDETDARAELFLGHHGAAVGAVVERLVAKTADVEYDADIDGIARGGLRGAGDVHEEEGHVHHDERGHEDEQLSHDKIWPMRQSSGKAALRTFGR